MHLKNQVSSSSPFFDETTTESILNDIKLTLKSGRLTLGPRTQDFEKEFSEYIGAKHAVAVNSGTAALEIMLRFLNIGDKEVIVPTNTFVATPTAVYLCGGKPVFADMKADTLCIDLEDLKKRVSPKTTGVITVHVSGLICPQMAELRSFCRDNKLFLLEDAAHAHGAMIDGQKAGNLCDGGAFSFYPTKVMTTGQGGMITTNDSKMAEVARRMRDHGLDSNRIMVMIGDNWCMSEVTAIIGKSQLAHLEEFVSKRNQIAQNYNCSLRKISDVSLFETPTNIRNSYYKYPMLLDDNLNREKIASIMKNQFGIETGSIYYPPCHLHPWFMENLGTKKGDLPVSEKVLSQVICLPIHPHLSDEQVQYILKAFSESIDKVRRL